MDATLFRAALAARDPIVLDGGLATQLEAQGGDLSGRLWSARLLVEEPEAIMAAHLAFYRAGARVATTASYQATFEGFAARGIDRSAAETLLRRSVDLALAARGRHERERVGDGDRAGNRAGGGDRASGGDRAPGSLFVAASIGPYGAMLADGSEYRGRYGLDVARLADFHRERLLVLAGTDADILAVETIPELEEAVAVAGLLEEAPGAAAWISFSCADAARIRSGAPIEEAVEAVCDAPGVLAIGVNCTAPEHAAELVARIRAVTALPIAVYPNSGEGWDAVTRRWTGPPSGLTDGVAAAGWAAAGATLIGGCCRVSPSQIGAMASALAIPMLEA